MKNIIDDIKWNASKIMEEDKVRIVLQKVKAHKGINGNEMADFLAKKGMKAAKKDKKYNRYENWLYISKKAIKNEIEGKIKKELKTKFEEWKKGTKYGKIFKDAKEKWTRKSRKEMRALKRGQVGKIIAIRTGHIHLGKYLNRMKKKDISEKCVCKKAEEEAKHLWNECKKDVIVKRRDKTIKKLKNERRKEVKRLEKREKSKNKGKVDKWWEKEKVNVYKLEEIIFPNVRHTEVYKKGVVAIITEFFQFFTDANEWVLSR